MYASVGQDIGLSALEKKITKGNGPYSNHEVNTWTKKNELSLTYKYVLHIIHASSYKIQ